jgi:hypothetical protein
MKAIAEIGFFENSENETGLIFYLGSLAKNKATERPKNAPTSVHVEIFIKTLATDVKMRKKANRDVFQFLNILSIIICFVF